jgi:putative hydrolase of the HAD superfamily
MNEKNVIKGLIFDYGQVIGLQDKNKKSEMIKILNLDHEMFHKTYYKYRADYDLGIISPEEYWNRFRSDHNISLSEREMEEIIKIDIESWLCIDEQMLSFIREIRPLVPKIAIISNMPMPIMKEIEKRFSWLSLFDSLVFSCNLKIVKPAPEIYRHCIEEIKLEPEECLFIDDAVGNIKGAEAIGLNTLLFTGFDDFMGKFKEYEIKRI